MTVTNNRLLNVAAIFAIAGAAVAGPENAIPKGPGIGGGSAEGPIVIKANAAATPVGGIPYYEYFHYSSYAKRSYVPGYTPHVTSLFENPRDYPWALGALATPYYMYAGLNGWFFSSPQGYQSSVPPGSHASKYFRGELGITDDLRGGYAQGMRVVEPAIVPVGASAEKGGIYIHGIGVETVLVGQDITDLESMTQTVRPQTGRPMAPRMPPPVVPGPAPTPASLEK